MGRERAAVADTAGRGRGTRLRDAISGLGEPDAAGRGSFVSLFSGIGGLDLALEALGFRCVAQVENDPYCTGQLERHWPDVPRWGDVATFGTAELAITNGLGCAGREAPSSGSDRTGPEQGAQPEPLGRGGASYAEGIGGGQGGPLPAGGAPALICGGFPCQPVSHAGRRRGQADERWLWPEFARVVGELRPRYVVVENVPGLLSIDRGRAVSEVVGDLAAMGYVGRHGTVRASDIGAPHRRERFFLIAYATGGDSRLGEAADVRREADEPRTSRRRNGEVADSDLTGLEGRTLPLGGGTHERPAGSNPSAAADTHQQRCEERGLHALGRQDISDAPRSGRFGSDTEWGPYEPAIRRWERVMGHAPAPLESGRLSADFVEWMMGFPPGWTDGRRNQRLKALGNAVVWQQAVHALSRLGLKLGSGDRR